MSGKEFEKALQWWRRQGDNSEYEIVKTGMASAGRWGFIEVFWQHKGLAGRDRVYRRGNGYELVEVMG